MVDGIVFLASKTPSVHIFRLAKVVRRRSARRRAPRAPKFAEAPTELRMHYDDRVLVIYALFSILNTIKKELSQ